MIVPNPVLPGFHPDPCLIRQGDWFYIATSTFEWWPGVQINRSRDLAAWELVGYALTRKSQIDMRGVPDSGGVWAPALSYSDGLYWLVYSNVRGFDGPFKDVTNYLITAPEVTGPWSDPVVLNRSGFDPSLFHDDDGRKWLLNQLWKPGSGRECFAGVVIQEYSVAERRLLGEPRLVFAGSPIGGTEGPHLYKKDGYYYLIVAEGGTSWTHAVSVARSRDLFGPYELPPQQPLLTSADDPTNPLQKSGHGSLAQDAQGNWFLAHLCSRVVPGTRRCTLGRETAIQRVEWPQGDWPRLAGGGSRPSSGFEVAEGRVVPYFPRWRDDFDAPDLSLHWNTLREPASNDWLSLDERPGHLRLYGRDSIQSLFDQSLVGCRIAHHQCDIETALDYQPKSFQQRAGLCVYYNTVNYYQCYVSGDDGERHVGILRCDNRRHTDDATIHQRLPAKGRIGLRASIRNAELTFHFRVDDGPWQAVGATFDATTVSDDYPMEGGIGWFFTGSYAVLCAQDTSDARIPADFDWFSYESLE